MTRLRIDVEYLTDTLRKLLETPSPTGYTDSIVRWVSAELERLGLDVELTRRGAIRAIRPGKEKRGARAIVSHVDTLGAQVKFLKDNGRLALVPIGNWSARFAEGARATVFTEKGTYRGTILPLKASGHTFNEEIDAHPIGWEYVEMRVDALARSTPDLARLGIDVGDIIAIDPLPEFLDNGFIVSRHLDNKAGVAVMLAALKAMQQEKVKTPVDIHWLFTIAEEVGVGASSVLKHEVASMITVDNGTTAPGQNSNEFGVTISMADQTGPFDYHLTKKLVDLCRSNEILFQKDVFRYYRSDSASAIEAGADVRTALITFGVDASHGYERIHVHALRSLSELITAYAASTVAIKRDFEETGSPKGFTKQPVSKAQQTLSPNVRASQLDLEKKRRAAKEPEPAK
ncbi:peptidase M42 family hydrolase [Rhodobium orientis]|uniref:Osmoprotectant NAGGN system M42 family peptidase n=1 Tax=Rhodobium orientis TaxID=34017 RepID=A0A327JIU2_9HYPH|nr:osmoprotectant NAGGN system M42 family peptidase [Rhodobium orientis]MBB4305254.1 peptidase M42 family hydrolase [Rhodobium orientis]MBK5952118.1 peptidase M42 [Rhodobium orientis]RAI26327.1 osmoprotectant NAGGN system M42 family peptidase [Rhodobium orientis]